MSPNPQQDPVSRVNALAADLDFLKLSDDEQKYILTRAGGASGAQPPNPRGTGSTGPRLKGSPDPAAMDSFMDVIRPILSGVAAASTGPLGYLAADTAMQKLKHNPSTSLTSQALGLEPGGIPSSLANTGEMMGMGKLLEGLSSVVGKGVKGFLNADQPDIAKFLPTTSQLAQSQGMPVLSTAAKTFEDLSIGAKQKALDRSAGAGFTESLKMSRNSGFPVNQNVATGQFITAHNPQAQLSGLNQVLNASGENAFSDLPALNKVISDPVKLQDVLSTAQSNGVDTNVKKGLQAYQFSKMFNNATTKSLTEGSPYSQNIVKLNPQGLANDWLDPEMQDSFKKLYNNQQRSDITQFFKNIAETQDKISSNPIARKFWLLHGGVGLATSLFTGSVTAGAEAALGSIGILVGAEGVGKLLTNPKVARTIVAMAGGEPLGISEQLAGRMIAQGLNGQVVRLINKDGTKTPVLIKDGKLVSVPQQ